MLLLSFFPDTVYRPTHVLYVGQQRHTYVLLAVEECYVCQRRWRSFRCWRVIKLQENGCHSAPAAPFAPLNEVLYCSHEGPTTCLVHSSVTFSHSYRVFVLWQRTGSTYIAGRTLGPWRWLIGVDPSSASSALEMSWLCGALPISARAIPSGRYHCGTHGMSYNWFRQTRNRRFDLFYDGLICTPIDSRYSTPRSVTSQLSILVAISDGLLSARLTHTCMITSKHCLYTHPRIIIIIGYYAAKAAQTS